MVHSRSSVGRRKPARLHSAPRVGHARRQPVSGSKCAADERGGSDCTERSRTTEVTPDDLTRETYAVVERGGDADRLTATGMSEQAATARVDGRDNYVAVPERHLQWVLTRGRTVVWAQVDNDTNVRQ